MTLTQGHFQFIADTIKSAHADRIVSATQAKLLADHFAVALAANNPKFKKHLFVRACGVEGS
jgi:hypothetical protein